MSTSKLEHSVLNDIQVAATNRLLEALQESENRMRMRINLLVEIVFEMNNEGEITFFNAAWKKVLGYKAVSRTKLINYIHPEDLGVFQAALSSLGIDSNSRSNVLIRFKHADGHVLTMSASFVLLETGILGALHDVTKQIEFQNELAALAHYDPLTKLPNRRLLGDRLEQAITSARRHNHRVGVVFVDLDDFKTINDSYGHQVGDAVLREFGFLIRGAVRETDSISRFGGDEFVVVLTELDSASHCELVVQRILDVFQKKITIGEIEIELRGSIGVTLYPNDHVDAEQLIRHSDQAMYLAKQAGKNQVRYFDAESNSKIITKNSVINQIKSALADRQFIFHYQPKIDLNSGVIFGVEALIRWAHPEKGLISPGLFLPAIENSPLNMEIGKFAVENAVAQIARWNELGLHLEININISGTQLYDPGFYDFVVQVLGDFPHVKPSHLQFEVLETSAIISIERTASAMKRFNELGISFALDDFGTGYSSLSNLRSLHIQTLKIDQSFVFNMLNNKQDLSIVKSVIALSKAFDCKVLAEGVETPECVQALRELGCDAAQGYYYSPAIPAEDLYKLATARPACQSVG